MIEENKNFWENCGHTYEEHVDVDNQDLKNRVMFGTYESGRFDGVRNYGQILAEWG